MKSNLILKKILVPLYLVILTIGCSKVNSNLPTSKEDTLDETSSEQRISYISYDINVINTSTQCWDSIHDPLDSLSPIDSICIKEYTINYIQSVADLKNRKIFLYKNISTTTSPIWQLVYSPSTVLLSNSINHWQYVLSNGIEYKGVIQKQSPTGIWTNVYTETFTLY